MSVCMYFNILLRDKFFIMKIVPQNSAVCYYALIYFMANKMDIK